MKIFFEILLYVPLVIIGFIVLAFAIRIIAKILFRTFYEEKSKHKNEKETQNDKNNCH
jgi:Na+-transporting methylmalonyl-CoA/oxaloacetate decarboxylase gamma subunit